MNKDLTYEEFRRRVSGGILTEDGSCPVTQVTRMLQGKWKLEILYTLCKRSPLRFGELRRMLGRSPTPCSPALCVSWRRTAWSAGSSSTKSRPMWSTP